MNVFAHAGVLLVALSASAFAATSTRVVTPAAATAAVARRATEAGWQRIAPPLVPLWPRDHGAHPAYRTEWWYATAELAAASGERFGVQVTIFRQGLDPTPPAPDDSPLRAKQVLAGHVVVIDLASGRLVRAERIGRVAEGLASASTSGLDVRLGPWTVRADGTDGVVAHASDPAQSLALDLALRARKRIVMHGTSGVSQKGSEPGNASAYMSWTRMDARATLALDGRTLELAGEAWFDHEWGSTQLGADVVGWDWFGLRLEDGRDLMLYRLRRADGSAHPASSATLVTRDGNARSIPLARFTLTTGATWTSPHTGAVYPTRWHLVLAEEQIDLELAPRVPDCEVDARRSTGVVYWEGPVAATGAQHASGYGELTGHAGSLAGRF